MTKKYSFLGVVLLGLLISPPLFALSDKIYKELDLFTRIIEILDKQYVDPVDEHEMVQGAIEGMLMSLDPHTVYLPPDLYKDFQSDTSGQFGGVGIEITLKDGVLTVVSPVEDTPAFKAGIHSGDRIVKINGEGTKGMGLIDAVHKMRGPKGKKVVITVWREGWTEPQDFSIVREIIKMQSVKSELLEGGIAYARITSFQEQVADTLDKTLKKMEHEAGGKLKGILLDLRDNPGGLLSEGIDVSDLFLSGGVIVSTRGREKEMEVKQAKKNSSFEDLPMVVLVNRGSASASEIVAGALQDNHRAKILGTTSFGKGSVQTLIELGSKEALKITVARYYTPKGKSIEGRGIVPDVAVGQGELNKAHPKKEGVKRPELTEFQKQRAVEYLKAL